MGAGAHAAAWRYNDYPTQAGISGAGGGRPAMTKFT